MIFNGVVGVLSTFFALCQFVSFLLDPVDLM